MFLNFLEAGLIVESINLSFLALISVIFPVSGLQQRMSRKSFDSKIIHMKCADNFYKYFGIRFHDTPKYVFKKIILFTKYPKNMISSKSVEVNFQPTSNQSLKFCQNTETKWEIKRIPNDIIFHQIHGKKDCDIPHPFPLYSIFIWPYYNFLYEMISSHERRENTTIFLFYSKQTERNKIKCKMAFAPILHFPLALGPE